MKRRIKMLGQGAILAVLGLPAQADGLTPALTEAPVVAPAPVVIAPPAAPSADWTGFYIGGQLSYGLLRYEVGDAASDDNEFTGAIGGLHAGYQRDFGRVVAGPELAYDWANLDADEDGPTTFDPQADLDGVFRAGVRAGYDAGRALPYITAGYARATYSEDVTGTGSDSDSADGYYFGGGVEVALNDRWIIGGEVLRHEFDLNPATVDDLDTSLTTFGLRTSLRF